MCDWFTLCRRRVTWCTNEKAQRARRRRVSLNQPGFVELVYSEFCATLDDIKKLMQSFYAQTKEVD